VAGDSSGPTRVGIRSARLGAAVNAVLALTKFVAGVVGNSYALVADAIESATDIVSSTIVWSGLRVAAREPDEEYPFGYGKAESVAAASVALLIVVAAIFVATEAVLEIRTPHHAPAPWTLAVLAGVVTIKWLLSRHVQAVGDRIGSGAVRADAWHHLSDAVTSAAAFVGISIALIGGPGWEAADDWAALAASGVILYNGLRMLRSSLHELMDRSPERDVVEAIRRAAHSVVGVLATEKLAVRKAGLGFRVTIHVQADPSMSLFDAHVLSGRVKGAIRNAVPRVASVLVHMEPYQASPVTPLGSPRSDRQGRHDGQDPT
jgi:cation diffusion facilitator family transporter